MPESSAVPGSRVMLRQLVIATDADDFELPAWTTILDQIGTPYDVLFAKQEALGTDRLVRSDGVGRYNAILLTSNTLFYHDGSGQYVSAFDDTEWETLWDYERTYQVRQVAINAAPVESPEDYYLRASSEGSIGDTPVFARLTSSGAERLRPPQLGYPDSHLADLRLPHQVRWIWRRRAAADVGF